MVERQGQLLGGGRRLEQRHAAGSVATGGIVAEVGGECELRERSHVAVPAPFATSPGSGERDRAAAVPRAGQRHDRTGRVVAHQMGEEVEGVLGDAVAHVEGHLVERGRSSVVDGHRQSLVEGEGRNAGRPREPADDADDAGVGIDDGVATLERDPEVSHRARSGPWLGRR